MATIVMLAIIAMLGSKNPLLRFASFAYIFGIWDLSYYGALKLLLNWPPSLLTWDVLFLIPVPWVAPVLAPMVCSFIMMAIAGWIFLLQGKGYRVKLGGLESGLIILGVLMLEDRVKPLPEFPGEKLNMLRHMILSHHGQLEFGSPRLPMFAEAMALHYLDNLDAKLKDIADIIAEDQGPDTEWTDYSRRLERKLYKG